MANDLTTDTARQSGQLQTGQTGLDPVEAKRRIAVGQAIGPALALVGGATMSRDARKEWMATADIALAHIHPDRLHVLARRAMRTADHPSKIVPAIIREHEATSGFKSAPNFGVPEPDRADTRSDAERAAVAQGLGDLAKRLAANLEKGADSATVEA